MYNEFQTKITEYDESNECVSKGICSVNPRLTSLHEVVLVHLKELAFYLLKLNDLKITNRAIKDTVIDALSGILANSEYSQQQFQKIISELNSDIEQSKALYQNFCEKSNINAESLKSYFKRTKVFNLTEAIKKGEKYSLKKRSSFVGQQKDLYDIMLFLVKSMCIKIIELERLGKEDDEYYYGILSMLNIMNLPEFSEEKIKEEINKSIELYYKLVVTVFYTQVEHYGEMTPVDVSFSTTPGKAILVSGSDYKKLELVLQAVENSEISVYTHGQEMLLAHAFPKLRSHPNLKGHFGLGSDNSVIDFSEFPGPILMTKLTLNSTVSLYRGHLFTLDSVTTPGVIQIKENNYDAVIKAAHESKGFVHGREKPSTKVGYSEKEIYEKLDEIIAKLKTNEIKHLYIVGLFNYPNSCDKYFESFFKALPEDCFAISLSCNVTGENIFHVDSFFDYSLLYKILKYLNEKLPINELKMSVFVSKCEKHTIAALLYLKHIGIKNVYMCKCPSILINPALMETLHEIYEIKKFSDARSDIQATLAE